MGQAHGRDGSGAVAGGGLGVCEWQPNSFPAGRTELTTENGEHRESRFPLCDQPLRFHLATRLFHSQFMTPSPFSEQAHQPTNRLIDRLAKSEYSLIE